MSSRKWNFVDLLQSAKPENEIFPIPYYNISPYRFHYSLHGRANVWLDPFRVLSVRAIFRILRDRVLFRILSDRVFYRPSVIRFSLGYSVIGFLIRALFKVLSNRVLFKVILRILSKASNLVFSVLVFWYPVCHQLHQQL